MAVFGCLLHYGRLRCADGNCMVAIASISGVSGELLEAHEAKEPAPLPQPFAETKEGQQLGNVRGDEPEVSDAG